MRLLNLRSVDANEKYEVLLKLFKLPGNFFKISLLDH